MAPLPTQNTARYWVDYEYEGQQHTMMFRHNEPDLGTITDKVGNFLQSIGPLLSNQWSVVSARAAAIGSTISFPVEPPDTPIPGGQLVGEANFPRFFTYTGRGTTSGRRVRLFIYGLTLPVPGDYRYSSSEQAILEQGRAQLDNDATGAFLTVAGDIPQWYLYFNAGYNSYHERRQRRSG